ncbi:TPA: acyltransferase family protein [Proteus mirabilis]|nr:acyltransferase family protein [Proteus mirabilis]HEJ0214538.1 acyltransferase family protein [Proteus mirabilis]HEJ1045861.1 acyltransferase family protein [Proteus mirabilis]
MENRVHWLDSARAIAIMLVVFTHAHERSGDLPYYIKSIFYSIDRIGVPIFFMISGGLLIPKLSNIDILTFYKNKIPKFIFLLSFYTIITNVIFFVLDGVSFTDAFTKSIIDFNAIFNTKEKIGIYGHARQMWFMYSIIGIYLIAPFLSKILTNSETKDILIFFTVCVLLNQFRLTMRYYFGSINSFDRIGIEMTGSYISYFIIGYVIINRIKVVKCGYVTLFLTAIIPPVILLLTEMKTERFDWIIHWYAGSIYILISSISVFLIIKKFFHNKNIKLLNILSKYSFGIYLIHYAMIFVVLKVISLESVGQYSMMIIIFSLTIVLSVIYCNIISKNKLTKKYLM